MATMKRKQSDDSSEGSSSALSLSKDEIQELISKEVRSALEQSDKVMKALMDRIQEVENENRYDSRIRKLEAHIRKIHRRGDAIFSDIQKRGGFEVTQDQNDQVQNLPMISDIKTEAKMINVTSFANGAISGTSTSEDVSSVGGVKRKPKEGFWQSLSLKTPIVNLTDNGEVCKQNGIKNIDSPQTSSQDTVDSRLSSLDGDEISCPVMVEKKPEAQEAEVALWSRLPPFPHAPFPHQLPAAAACKSMPQKPVVKVARIKNPQGIALLWNVEEEDPDAAAMDCYYIYVAQERGDGTFSKWKTIGVIKAMPLPMACRVAAERSRDKTLCFIIIGKDIFGRYGPYSDVHTVWAGET